jgi:hypothetical protein
MDAELGRRDREGGLFDDLPVQFETPPEKPFGRTGRTRKRGR